jgi:hypothetical protein
MSKVKLVKKIASLFDANLEDAKTKEGRPSKGQIQRADGSTYGLMGDDLIRIKSNIDQYKGSAKTLGALSVPALLAFTNEKSEPLESPKEASDFEKAFSKAFKAGDDVFVFKGKEYTTELRKGKSKGGVERFDAVQGYKDMYNMFERSLAAAETEEQRQTIEKNFLRDTSNVSEMTKIAALKEMDKERMAREGKAEGGKFPDLTGDGEVTQADVLKGRGVFNEGGSMMMPPEGMPVDTYSNIPEDEMDEALASQLPDDEMEEDYIKYVMDESLNDEEQMYLAGALQDDDRLSDILDKVIATASEFSGAGEVDGPGTGVSDSIPARLSDGEFVFTKKATDQIGAENLQRMMDDAERAYDGGVMMAEGGMMDEEDPMSQTQEEIEKLMMGANRMPSLR